MIAKFDCEGCEYEVIPGLSDRTMSIFRAAFVAGEVHCDRMPNVPTDTWAFVHEVYDEFKMATAGRCGDKTKVATLN